MPHLLVADDNAVTRQFFAACLEGAGHRVDLAADGAQAWELAGRTAYDLLLLDLNMPHLGGGALLARLRAAGVSRAPAIATSADLSRPQIAALLAAGFADVVGKPVDTDTLRRHVARALAGTQAPVAAPPAAVAAAAQPPYLDDAQALTATGSEAIVAALRGLFLGELATLADELKASLACGDLAGLRDRLHRLRASCGLCGAAALAQAGLELRHAVDAEPALVRTRFDALLACAQATRAALAARQPA